MERIQAMIFQRLSEVLMKLPIGGIVPATLPCARRLLQRANDDASFHKPVPVAECRLGIHFSQA